MSLVLHVLALAALSAVDLGLRAAYRERVVDAGLASNADPEPGELEASPPTPDDVDLRTDLPARERVAADADLPGAADTAPPPSSAYEHAATPPDAREPPSEPLTTALAETGRATLGVGAAQTAMNRSFGKDDAAEAMRRVGGALAGDPFAGRVLERVRRSAGGRRVVVLQGEFDQCEDVLRGLGIAHELFDPVSLATAPLPADVRVAILNCSPKPLPAQALVNVRAWVERGGYLLTTDWGIETILDRAFPEYVQCVRRGQRVEMLEEQVVNVEVTAEHALLRGLPAGHQTARWWLEKSTIPVQIVRPDAVDVLIACPSLRLTHDAPGAAVTFRHGRGRVVHLLGHVHQQEGNLRGAYMVHRLLLNFLREALIGH